MVRAIKGFNHDMTCRGFKFEPGGEYQHDGRVAACSGGFHAVPDDVHPLTVFQFYAPAGSRYFRVECSGKLDRAEDKIASEIMRVSTDEISLRDLTLEAVKWVMDRSYHEGEIASGDRGAATASGDRGAATASGDRGTATASGTRGAATASGDQGAATASGDQGCAVSTGPDGMVRGDIDGIDLFAREIEWDGDKYVRKSIACGTTGENGIEAGVWYRCVAGRLVEADHG